MRTRHYKAGYSKVGRVNLLQLKKSIAILCCLIIAIISLILVFNVTSSAHNTYSTDTYYTNLCIDDGDTLWDIAKNNYTVEYGSFNDYINEIRSINHISNDVIHAGEYLVIPVCR
ncbi:MAG: LysM peptidoglycan-binding domain-containing protein [Lachnospiraceae bacterium]|nr:LysM peptidoglycan-binding domain-containing protein [Lachnospiraceae bacterium]